MIKWVQFFYVPGVVLISFYLTEAYKDAVMLAPQSVHKETKIESRSS